MFSSSVAELAVGCNMIFLKHIYRNHLSSPFLSLTLSLFYSRSYFHCIIIALFFISRYSHHCIIKLWKKRNGRELNSICVVYVSIMQEEWMTVNLKCIQYKKWQFNSSKRILNQNAQPTHRIEYKNFKKINKIVKIISISSFQLRVYFWWCWRWCHCYMLAACR